MDFNYEQYAIDKLFSIGKVYSVPRFQREYSWGKIELKTFYDDILEHITLDSNGQLKTEEYFIGNLLFVGDMNSKENSNLDIIDGQQRLTTITIALSTIATLFKENGEKQLSDLVFKYVYRTDDDGNGYPIFVNQTPNPYFQYKIQMFNKKVEPSSQEEDLIKEAYDFFIKKFGPNQLKTAFKNKGINNFSYIELLKSIRKQILNLTTICIWTKDRNNANSLFETLNAKGLELAAIDLIKNALFEKLNVELPTDDAVNKWKTIKSNLNSDRNIKIDFSIFYRHFWHATYKNSSEKKLYQDFNSLVKKSEYSEFLDKMVLYSKYYVNIIKPTEAFFGNQTHKQFIFQILRNLNNFNVTQVRVILLVLIEKYDKEILSQKNFKNILEFLEVFHFAFTGLTSSRPSALDKIYSETAKTILNLDDQQQIVNELNIMKNKLRKLLPEYLNFKERFVSLTYSKDPFNSSNYISKYVLNKLENYLSERDINRNDASIEHIINEDPDNEITLSIGNLTLLEELINNKMSEKEYSKKIPYYKKSSYSLMKQLLEKYQTFGEDDISNRASVMCDLFYEKILGMGIPKLSAEEEIINEILTNLSNKEL